MQHTPSGNDGQSTYHSTRVRSETTVGIIPNTFIMQAPAAADKEIVSPPLINNAAHPASRYTDDYGIVGS